MGWETALEGSLRLTRQAFTDLFSLRGLDWSFGDDSIADYLRQGFVYREAEQRLEVRCGHKMHHHAAFFRLLAAFKDLPGVDEFVQDGETYDAWFPTGRFFVRDGAWAYLGEGEMVVLGERRGPPIVRPARADQDQLTTADWRPAPALIRSARIDGDFLEVTFWRRAPVRVGFWSLDALCRNWDSPDASRFVVLDGGATLAWRNEAGGESFRVDVEEVLSSAES